MSSIAIDGPAGAGKSTIAKMLAKRLGYIYVDTGAMYRAMGVYFTSLGISETEQEKMSAACQDAQIDITYENGEQQVWLNGENITGRLRTPEASKMASACAVNKDVRLQLVRIQRALAKSRSVVMDGRDIGTYVLPDADLKIYLTASVGTRAKRRYDELVQKQEHVDLKQVEADMRARDAQDMNRAFAPLRQAGDAVCIDSSDMTVEQVLARMEALAAQTAD